MTVLLPDVLVAIAEAFIDALFDALDAGDDEAAIKALDQLDRWRLLLKPEDEMAAA